MLQETRDELELMRGGTAEPAVATSDKTKPQQDQFKRPARPSRLGGEGIVRPTCCSMRLAGKITV
jgi:hypothetical protein